MTITLGDPHVRNRSTGHIYFIITIFIIFFKDNIYIIHKRPTKYIKYNIIVGIFQISPFKIPITIRGFKIQNKNTFSFKTELFFVKNMFYT